ncbi:uncharacterized protein [Eurosta solidaginis]|uniref:uncharacterized protein n=1 Tax=Eurosta solidaginis TaxID=178769 RepID=UPI003530C7E9
MQSRKYSSVYFDREKIRSKLIELDYKQARRLKGPIYCALIKELFEEGCNIWGEHLENLVAKEDFLFETKVIRDRVCDDMELMMSLFENMRIAEKVHIINPDEGFKMAVKCQYNILKLLEPHKKKYDWLLDDVYNIIIPICEFIESFGIPNTSETIARIYFKIAQFSSDKESSLPFAIKFMERSLVLSRNEAWESDYVTEREFGVYPTLHLVAGRELSCFLLRYAKSVAKYDPKSAEELAHKATVAIAEVGLDKNKIQYGRALLARVNYIIQSEDYDGAMKILQKVRKNVPNSTDATMPKILSDLHLYEGICVWNSKDKTGALSKMEEALKFAVKSGEKHREADILVAIGKVYAANVQEQRWAREAFKRAKYIFGELGDVLNRKKAHYMLAKLKADEIFPYFMDMLKDGTENFCGFYNLRQWKNSCQKFWHTMGVEELKENKIYCLLEDEIKDTFAWSLQSSERH